MSFLAKLACKQKVLGFSKDLALSVETVLGGLGIKQCKNSKPNVGTYVFMQDLTL